MSAERMRALALLVLLTSTAAASPTDDWMDGLVDRVAADLADGKRLVVEVHVPLCDNTIIACGNAKLGDGDNPATNLYWATTPGFGRWFSRKGSGWIRTGVARIRTGVAPTHDTRDPDAKNRTGVDPLRDTGDSVVRQNRTGQNRTGVDLVPQNRTGVDSKNRTGVDEQNRTGVDSKNRAGVDSKNRTGVDAQDTAAPNRTGVAPAQDTGDKDVLEQVTYRRTMATPAAWRRRGAPKTFELEVVIRAWRGSAIDRALAAYASGISGGTNAQLVAFVGHNRLMDVAQFTWPKPGTEVQGTIAIACDTAPYMKTQVSGATRVPLLMTSDLLFANAAPLEAAVLAFARGGNYAQIRREAATAYAGVRKRPVEKVVGAFTNPADRRW